MGLSLNKVKKKVSDVVNSDQVQAAKRQIDIFDNGKTAKNKVGNGANLSVAQQVGNVAKGIVKPAVQVGNTANAALRDTAGLGKVAAISVFGNNDQYNRAVNDLYTASNKRSAAGSGALGVGTVFKDTNEAVNATPRQIAGKSIGYGTELGTSLVPELKVGGKIATRVGARVIANAGVGAVGSAAGQAVETGHVSPKQVAIDAAVSAALPEALRGAGKYVKAKDIQIGGSTKKTGEVVDPANFNAAKYRDEQVAKQKLAYEGEKPSAKTQAMDAKTAFKAKLIDAMSPIEDTINKATNKQKDVAPSKRFTPQVDRVLRANDLAEQYRVDNGFDDVIKNTSDVEGLSQYLIARQAEDVSLNGHETGRDLAKDREYVNQTYGEFEEQAQAINRYSQGLLDKAVEYGLIKPESAAYLKQRYPNYVPLERVFSKKELDATFKGEPGGLASISQQTLVKNLKGSSRQISDPLEALADRTHKLIAQGEKNIAANMLIDFKDLPDNPFGLRELKPSEVVGNKPVISALRDGKQISYEVEPWVAKAAKSLSKEEVGFIGKILNVGTRLLRFGATSANPAFALANLAKDTVGAAINSSSPARALFDPEVVGFAFRAALSKNSAEYGELRRVGAGGTSMDIARTGQSMTIKQIRSQRNLASKASYTVKHPAELLRAVEDIIGKTETYTRAAQYAANKNNALDAGMSELDAGVMGAVEARKNSANFYRGGDWARVLNTALPYLNAGIQGARSYVNAVQNRPVQTLAKTAMLSALPAGAVTAWNLQDEKRKEAYEKISDYEKETNLIIVPPNPKKGDDGRWQVIKIPIAPGTAGFHNVVRKTAEQMAGIGELRLNDIIGAVSQTTTSIDASNWKKTAATVVPQAIKPAAESMLNTNFFTGEQLVPDAIKNLDAEDQYNKGTSGTAKVIGKVTGASPLKVDNAIRTATGGLGQNIINISDRSLAKAGVISGDDVKGKGFGTSIANRFNSAAGVSDGAQYFTTLEKAAKDNKLAGSDYDQLNSLTTKALDQNGQPRLLNDNDDLERNQILRSSPNIAKTFADAAKALAKKTGKPVDPLYNLTPEQQYQYYDIKSLPYKGEDYQLAKEKMTWYDNFQEKRSKYFDKINASKNKAGASAQTRTDKVQFPTFDEATQNLLDQAAHTDDSGEKTALISAHPELQTAYDKLAQYTNDKRIATGRIALKGYPKADADTQKIIDQYNALPKADGDNGKNKTRNAWIKSNPDSYAKMQAFFAQTAVYQLANNAGLAKFEGQDLNQKALKATYSLGQYDIAKTTGADGKAFYSLDPEAVNAAKQASYGGSGGGKSGSGGSGSGSVGKRKFQSSNGTRVRYKKGKRIKAKKAKITVRSGKSGSRAVAYKGTNERNKVTLKASKV